MPGVTLWGSGGGCVRLEVGVTVGMPKRLGGSRERASSRGLRGPLLTRGPGERAWGLDGAVEPS